MEQAIDKHGAEMLRQASEQLKLVSGGEDDSDLTDEQVIQRYLRCKADKASAAQNFKMAEASLLRRLRSHLDRKIESEDGYDVIAVPKKTTYYDQGELGGLYAVMDAEAIASLALDNATGGFLKAVVEACPPAQKIILDAKQTDFDEGDLKIKIKKRKKGRGRR